MAFSVSVTRGYTMVAGVKPDVDDWNAAFLPVINISGLIGATEISDDAISFAALNPNFILSGTTTEDLDALDMLLVGQAASADNRVITFQHLLRSVVRECDDVLTFSDYIEDRIVFWRHADDLPICMGVARFFEQAIEQAPEAATTNQDWEVLVRRSTEADGAQAARTSLRNLLPDVITAQTVNNPTQVVVDAKGRVIAISNSEGAETHKTTGVAVPVQAVLGTPVASTPVAHGLGAQPSEYEVRLFCTTIDAGWQVGESIPISRVLWQPGGGSTLTLPAFTEYSDATNLTVLANTTAAEMLVTSKTTGSTAAFTPGSWTMTLKARK